VTKKRTTGVFYALVLVLVMGAIPAFGLSRKPPQPDYIPGRVLVDFKEGVTPERAAVIIEGEGCTVERVLKRTGLHLVSLPGELAVPEALELFKAYSEILYVEPDYRVELLEEK
jgi:hypothetical protein